MSYVTPGDLISLARTSRSIRSQLLARSMASIWCSALARVKDSPPFRGLPPIPSGMSPSAYAALVFSPWCSVCCFHRNSTTYIISIYQPQRDVVCDMSLARASPRYILTFGYVTLVALKSKHASTIVLALISISDLSVSKTSAKRCDHMFIRTSLNHIAYNSIVILWKPFSLS